MGLFRPYERSEDAAPKSEPTPPSAGTSKKQVPTPTRKQAEEARRERLHPTLTPAAQRKVDRASKAKQREDQWSQTDNQPGRALVRDFVDSRKGIAQWWMPVIVSSLGLALAVMYLFPAGAVVATFVPYLGLVAFAVHVFLLWRQFRALHSQRLPSEPLRGLLMYLINRLVSLRRFRVPLPRVNPGEEI